MRPKNGLKDSGKSRSPFMAAKQLEFFLVMRMLSKGGISFSEHASETLTPGNKEC